MVNLALGSTTVWPKLHLLFCSSIAHLAILSWNTNTWSDTTPLHGKSFGSVITINSFKYHRYLENVISYRRFCNDIPIAKIIVSEWVIFPRTATTRSYTSYIQNVWGEGGAGFRRGLIFLVGMWIRIVFDRELECNLGKLLFEKCSSLQKIDKSGI